MNHQQILRTIDHTQLKPFATWADIQTLCEEALLYHTASVCIPPSYVKRVSDIYGTSINICTVIGFPLGYSTVNTKIFEAKEAIEQGANEIDMVINMGNIKNKLYTLVLEEIKQIKESIGAVPLKVIIETCYLNEEEKIKLCQIVTASGADYIKTSTGFGTAGATIEDIKLLKEHIGTDIKIKAAGGIRTIEDMITFIDLGCARLGTSSAISLIHGETSIGY